MEYKTFSGIQWHQHFQKGKSILFLSIWQVNLTNPLEPKSINAQKLFLQALIGGLASIITFQMHFTISSSIQYCIEKLLSVNKYPHFLCYIDQQSQIPSIEYKMEMLCISTE